MCLVHNNNRADIIERISERVRFPSAGFSQLQAFVDDLTERDFLSVARWFHPTDAILDRRYRPILSVMGLRGSSHYLPARVAHQFGVDRNRFNFREREDQICLSDPHVKREDIINIVKRITNLWNELEPGPLRLRPINEDEHNHVIWQFRLQANQQI